MKRNGQIAAALLVYVLFSDEINAIVVNRWQHLLAEFRTALGEKIIRLPRGSRLYREVIEAATEGWRKCERWASS